MLVLQNNTTTHSWNIPVWVAPLLFSLPHHTQSHRGNIPELLFSLPHHTQSLRGNIPELLFSLPQHTLSYMGNIPELLFSLPQHTQSHKGNKPELLFSLPYHTIPQWEHIRIALLSHTITQRKHTRVALLPPTPNTITQREHTRAALLPPIPHTTPQREHIRVALLPPTPYTITQREHIKAALLPSTPHTITHREHTRIALLPHTPPKITEGTYQGCSFSNPSQNYTHKVDTPELVLSLLYHTHSHEDRWHTTVAINTIIQREGAHQSCLSPSHSAHNYTHRWNIPEQSFSLPHHTQSHKHSRHTAIALCQFTSHTITHEETYQSWQEQVGGLWWWRQETQQ